MIHLVYTSKSVDPFSKDDLVKLLAISRQNNEKLGVTGMLLYQDGNFMQALEGDEEKVRALSARIAKDPRHVNFATLTDAHCEEREFPDWSMGFQNLDQLDLRELPGYTTFLDSPLRSHAFVGSPATCRNFMLLFKTQAQQV